MDLLGYTKHNTLGYVGQWPNLLFYPDFPFPEERKDTQCASYTKIPQRWTANVTVGGKDRKTLFMTLTAERAALPRPGRGVP